MIENLITPDSIIFELEGNERDEVLAELTENLISRNACLDRNEVFQALVAREEKMSTIVEQSIAVPHIVRKSVQKTIVSLGISHDGCRVRVNKNNFNAFIRLVFAKLNIIKVLYNLKI